MTDELMARLKRLEAAESARDAITTYCIALDTYDLDLLRSVFTDDVTVHGQYMGDVSGVDEAIAYFKNALSKRPAHRKHYALNSKITAVEDDVVTATCYFFSYHGDTDDLHIAWGRYYYKTRLTGRSSAICDLTIVLDQPVSGLEAFKPSP